MQSAQILDGKKQAQEILERLKAQIAWLSKEYAVEFCLAVIIIGEDPASALYVKNKVQKVEELGIKSIVYRLSSDVSEELVISYISKMNEDPSVNGILVQLPMPGHIEAQNVIDAIDHRKDVDGFSTHNVGLLNSWQESLEPCTPQGVMLLLRSVLHDIAGKKVVVLGRSRIVGRPMVSLLIRAGASVTSLNSHSVNIDQECYAAEILISAVGVPFFIKQSWVKEGACVIDVGIMRVNGKLCGDVDFDNVKKVAGYITPVPGGVGPMTVACLMLNTVKAACRQYNIVWCADFSSNQALILLRAYHFQLVQRVAQTHLLKNIKRGGTQCFKTTNTHTVVVQCQLYWYCPSLCNFALVKMLCASTLLHSYIDGKAEYTMYSNDQYTSLLWYRPNCLELHSIDYEWFWNCTKLYVNAPTYIVDIQDGAEYTIP